ASQGSCCRTKRARSKLSASRVSHPLSTERARKDCHEAVSEGGAASNRRRRSSSAGMDHPRGDGRLQAQIRAAERPSRRSSDITLMKTCPTLATAGTSRRERFGGEPLFPASPSCPTGGFAKTSKTRRLDSLHVHDINVIAAATVGDERQLFPIGGPRRV